MRVHVGSSNPLKAEAVANVFRKVFKREIIVKRVKINLKIPEQPFDEETLQGAIERAKRAFQKREQVFPDYGVGIEGGLIRLASSQVKSLQVKDVTCELIFSVQFCAIIDKKGKLTVGHGSGFVLPDQIIAKLKQGQTLSRVMEELSGIKEIDKKMGAIGFLSKGLLNRRELTEQAVLMALIPRIRQELYSFEQGPQQRED